MGEPQWSSKTTTLWFGYHIRWIDWNLQRFIIYLVLQAQLLGLATGITKYEFLVQLLTWYNILFEINITSKILQQKEINFISANNQLQHSQAYLEQLRSDKGFDQIVVECVEIAKSLDFPTDFESFPVRLRRIQKQFSYEGRDEPITNTRQKLKLFFFSR